MDGWIDDKKLYMDGCVHARVIMADQLCGLCEVQWASFSLEDVEFGSVCIFWHSLLAWLTCPMWECQAL